MTEKSAAEITIGFVYDGEVAKVKIGEVALLDEMPELKWNLDPTVVLADEARSAQEAVSEA